MFSDEDDVVDDDVYDHAAVNICARLEQSIQKLRPPRQMALGAIIGALEVNVELGRGEPSVVNHLADAFLAQARADGIKEKNVTKLKQRLDDLRAHVEERARGR